ncbi:MAG: TolC family protein [Bacteroidetes bacterium]|nr:TolC family protein [Bacteroidota bacterium]
MKQVLLILGMAWALQMQAQLYTPESFIQQVKQFHPVAKQAAIQVEKAKADVQSARGGFDPSFNFDASNKTFDGKNYYYYNNPELKIPTGLGGLDIKTGLESNGGKYLNPEVSAGQTSYLGVEMPIGKGLLMDKRRATLQQAKIFQSQSQQDQLKMLNDLLFNAYNAYWQWAGAYQLYSIYNKYYQISKDRLRLVKIAFDNGDRATMDTVEAMTQVQNYEAQMTDARQKINSASLELSNFLWSENDSAYQLPTQYFPDTIQFVMAVNDQTVEALLSRSANENPSLKAYAFKLDALDVEKKLKFQSLLPMVNVKANLLNSGYNVVKGVDGNFFQNNYKWGIDVKLPLLFREGRGDYNKSKLKIQETNLEFNAKKWETENKIRNYYSEAILLQQQIRSVQGVYNGYLALFKAENLKFYNGESSLFLLNSRESKLIETAEKLVNLRIKYFKAKYAAEWAAGLLK